MTDMHVAIARPVPARNNTAFEAQLACYEWIHEETTTDVTIIADECNELVTKNVPVIECTSGLTERLTEYARRASNKVTHRYDFISSDYPSLSSIIATGDFDVVETSDPMLYPYAETVANACESSGIDLVCGSSVTMGLRTPVPTDTARRIMRSASGIICPTPMAHDRYVKAGLLKSNDGRVEYTGHPINTKRFSPRNREGDGVTVLSVGRLEKRKGFVHLVDAFEDLRSLGYNITWTVVGDGPLREWLDTTVRERGLEDNVTTCGVIDHGLIHQKYQNSDIFLLHSLRTESWEEYFGVAYAEAMSSGLPVVGSESGAIPWVVRDGEDGILVPEQDTDAIVQAMSELCEKPNLRQKMGSSGRENVKQRFSIPVVSEKFINVWDRSNNE